MARPEQARARARRRRAEPLLERVKFLAIFSSNLDEFFMVRVAGLLDQVVARVAVVSPDGRTPQQVLAEVREGVIAQTAAQTKLWRDELVPALADEGIVIGTIDDATEEELEELETALRPADLPGADAARGRPGPAVPLHLGAVALARRHRARARLRRGAVRARQGAGDAARFVRVGERGLMIPLESVISHYLSWVFPGMDLVERAAFRVTRDGDTEISDDADDLLEAVESELRKRRFGAVVRLEVASSMTRSMQARLTERLAVRADAVYAVPRPARPARDDAALQTSTGPTSSTSRGCRRPSAASQSRPTATSSTRSRTPTSSCSTRTTRSRRASRRSFARRRRIPAVVTLKTTVYRTSHDSALAPALIEAAENGKQSVCIVELKARFDERRNIEWARSLEQAGVHVVYGFPDLKIHAKTTLVIRREGDGLQRYVHIGTGNYHATTARIYEDVGLFTADPDISADIADLFNYVTGFGRPGAFRKILVAPFNLRRELVERIRAVGAAAAAGEPARIRIKVNNIADPAIVEELYKASQAGAEDRPDRARGLHAAAGCRGPERAHPRPFRARAVPRAQPALLLRGGRGAELLPRQRRPDAAQPRPPDRDGGARRGAPRAGRDRDSVPPAARTTTCRRGRSTPTARGTRVQPENGERRRASQLVAMRGRMRTQRRSSRRRLDRRLARDGREVSPTIAAAS